jgi:hypothetical protein
LAAHLIWENDSDSGQSAGSGDSGKQMFLAPVRFNDQDAHAIESAATSRKQPQQYVWLASVRPSIDENAAQSTVLPDQNVWLAPVKPSLDESAAQAKENRNASNGSSSRNVWLVPVVPSVPDKPSGDTAVSAAAISLDASDTSTTIPSGEPPQSATMTGRSGHEQNVWLAPVS